MGTNDTFWLITGGHWLFRVLSGIHTEFNYRRAVPSPPPPPPPPPPNNCGYPPMSDSSNNGPLVRYEKLRVAHAPGMPGTFFSTTAGWWSRHASRHVREARAVMHAGIANYAVYFEIVGGENVSGIPVWAAEPYWTWLITTWISKWIISVSTKRL